MVNGSRVYPGIKELPPNIRQNFRNDFIRFILKKVANSQSPWVNPDVSSLQEAYDIVFPTFPAQVRHSDAVFHPVSGLVSCSYQRPPKNLYNVKLQDRLGPWGPPQSPRFRRQRRRPTTSCQCVPPEEARHHRCKG
jgi:hypothetical protein